MKTHRAQIAGALILAALVLIALLIRRMFAG
jgi:hypothetical protein